MADTGKTGADAMFRAMHRIAINLLKYDTKFRIMAAAALAAGVITSAEYDAVIAFLATVSALDAALNKLAGYSGF